jgi:AcrR family transcriptional regulator
MRVTVQAPRARRGPYRKGIEQRQKMISVAVEVFGQNGFKGGTLQQVADRVGLTPGAIMKLFGSKEGLLIAVLEHWGKATAEVVGPGLRGRELLEGFRRLMSYHVRHPGLLSLYITMAAEATSPEHPAHAFMTERYSTSLKDMRELFAEAVSAGHFRSLNKQEIAHEAEFLLATMDGLEIQFLLNPSFDLESSFGAYVDRLNQRLAPA